MQQQGLPNCCKSRGCPRSKASKGEAVGFLLRDLGNAGDGVSSAFPPGKKHDNFFIIMFHILSCFLCNSRVYPIVAKAEDATAGLTPYRPTSIVPLILKIGASPDQLIIWNPFSQLTPMPGGAQRIMKSPRGPPLAKGGWGDFHTN